jgi:hypothetical protein
VLFLLIPVCAIQNVLAWATTVVLDMRDFALDDLPNTDSPNSLPIGSPIAPISIPRFSAPISIPLPIGTPISVPIGVSVPVSIPISLP